MGMEELREMRARLDRLERTEGRSGAVPLSPKQALLQADEAQEKNPEHRIRWVNTLDKQKVNARIQEGYERVPITDGGKELGNLVLFRMKRDTYNAKVRRFERLNEERLVSHNKEMEETADAVAKILRDKYGLDVSGENILVTGG